MSIDERDLIRLQHILQAGRETMIVTASATRQSLDDDFMVYHTFRDQHPQIPWHQIKGMRNFLIHEYFRVDKDILWDTAIESIPELVAYVEKLVSSA